eukprot:1251460-Pyramimonas_sp.AAC.1
MRQGRHLQWHFSFRLRLQTHGKVYSFFRQFCQRRPRAIREGKGGKDMGALSSGKGSASRRNPRT